MRQINSRTFRYVAQLFFCNLLSFIFLSNFANAAQMVEHLDRMEINWSTQKIRFYGESGVSENALKGVDGAEKIANYFRKFILNQKKDYFALSNVMVLI